MTQFLSALIVGLGSGAIYALVAIGFVMIFKATGVISFAQPAFLMSGAIIVSFLAPVMGFYVGAILGVVAIGVVGGILQLTTVSQSSGTTDTNLTAIAAAVIGGTSLFGGRGSAYAALLGMLVLQAITAGLNLINVESEVRFMVTGAVLLLAVAIDSVSRRLRSSSGRG